MERRKREVRKAIAAASIIRVIYPGQGRARFFCKEEENCTLGKALVSLRTVKCYVSLRSTEATDLEVRRTRGKASRNVFRSVVSR